MSAAIKACPFCGSAASAQSGMGEVWIRCDNHACNAVCSGRGTGQEDKAIGFWNKRTPDFKNLLDALDHIARVSLGSSSHSVRNKWIADRAVSALNGDDNWKQCRKPKNYHDACENKESAE
jgi:hypothetical protein